MSTTPRLLGGQRRGTLPERFWRAVSKSADGCWLWTGSVNTYGYGQIRDESGRYTSAHRVSWRLANGPIPEGQSVLHRCDTPRCVRPDHLFLGSQADNMRDKREKARQCRGSRHPFSKLTEAAVVEIRAAIANGESFKTIAQRHGVTYHAIADISQGKRWKHVRGAA